MAWKPTATTKDVEVLRVWFRKARVASFIVFAACSLFFGRTVEASDALVVATSKSGWLLWIAEARGLFEKHEVNVSVELTDSGVTAGEGLIDGRYDMATMSEFAFVSRSFANPDLRVFGTVAAIYNVRLVGRPDSGFESISDLPGKTIGLRSGAIGEFFLGKVVELNGMSLDDVVIRDIQVPDLPRSLKEGDVDAVVSWEPYATEAMEAVGDGALFEEVQLGQPYYFALVASQGTLDKDPHAAEGLLKALLEASDWAMANQSEAKRVLADVLGLSAENLDRYWDDHVMEVAVAQDMLFLMEQEARWRIQRGLSDGEMPNFLERIDPNPLKRVAPHLVSVID